MVTEVSQATANTVRHSPAEQIWNDQREIIYEIKNHYKFKKFDEENKEGSPGDDKIRLVFQVASVETAGIASKRRVFESPTKTNPSEGLLVVSWNSGWWED